MKFENLEEMSKCPGLIFAVNVLGLTNKQKICQNLKKKKKKKNIDWFSGRKAGENSEN